MQYAFRQGKYCWVLAEHTVRHNQESQGSGHQRSSQKQWETGLMQALQQPIGNCVAAARSRLPTVSLF